jgi:DNA replication protein DnaC
MMRPLSDIPFNISRPSGSDAEEIVYRPADQDICPICKGAGWLRLDVPLGHPSFGRLFKCECTQRSAERARANEMRRLSQLDGLESKSFETFEAGTPELARALEIAKSFVQKLSGWLVLTGPCGTGKTHLAAAIANQTLEAGDQTVMFAVVPDLLDHLRATFEPSQGIAYDQRFNDIRNTYLLVLDDIGTENATPWAREKLYQIINHRYNERLPTVITSNQPDSAIDERILSRMLDRDLSQRLQMIGEDYRRRGDPTYLRGRRRRVSA